MFWLPSREKIGDEEERIYKAASDFRFEFKAEVICEDPHSSGFMDELTPDCGHNEEAATPRYVLHQLVY